MLNLFAIVLIVFIGLLILIFKNQKLKNAINIKKLYPNKVKRNKRNNKKFLTNKNNFSYKHEEKKYSVFYKNSQKNKMFSLFKGNTEDKLKALPILRKGLREISPEVVKISAF